MLPNEPSDVSSSAFIYAICDEARLPRYVGKSVDPHARFRAHLRDREKSPKAAWIAELKGSGKGPLLIILDEVDEREAVRAEKRWISRFRARGLELLNRNHGGGGRSVSDEPTAADLAFFQSVYESAGCSTREEWLAKYHIDVTTAEAEMDAEYEAMESERERLRCPWEKA